MPRTFSTKHRKVKQHVRPLCPECGYELRWESGFLLPGRWACPGENCLEEQLHADYMSDYFGDEPDWTQG